MLLVWSDVTLCLEVLEKKKDKTKIDMAAFAVVEDYASKL